MLEAHRAVGKAGKKLVLLDNAPSGLRPGLDYLAVSSADNSSSARSPPSSSPCAPYEGVVGILNYEAEFFVTNEREIAFRKWMSAGRPDITLVRERFGRVEDAGAAYRRLLAGNDDLDCCFIAWDVPARPCACSQQSGKARAACLSSRSISAMMSSPSSAGRGHSRGWRRNVPTIKALPPLRPCCSGSSDARPLRLALSYRPQSHPRQFPRSLRSRLARPRPAVDDGLVFPPADLQLHVWAEARLVSKLVGA